MPLPRPQLARYAAKACLQLERWREGTVRFTLVGAKPFIRVQPDWFTDHVTGPVYCIGREKWPPLENVSRKSAQRKFPLLTKHRAVILKTPAEVTAVAGAIMAAGWCVNNDVYLFPPAGEWLAYVSHHDEILVDIRPHV
jgi:hypothetical protein